MCAKLRRARSLGDGQPMNADDASERVMNPYGTGLRVPATIRAPAVARAATRAVRAHAPHGEAEGAAAEAAGHRPVRVTSTWPAAADVARDPQIGGAGGRMLR